MSEIAQNLLRVRQAIADAAKKSRRSADSVTLVAVSKRHSVELIRQAYAAGQRHFGENYLQEALAKQAELADCADIHWHAIGRLQTKKVAVALDSFAYLHALESEKQLAVLAKFCQQGGVAPQGLFAQINLTNEATKGGLLPEQVEAFADRVEALGLFHLNGLMTIPPPVDKPTDNRHNFEAMRRMQERLNAQGRRFVRIDALSMGMSRDFAVAIEEGATMVRVGEAIFGARQN